ncbi:PepSY domain-containing protein [Pseudaminobacter sp. 19-2017]|uniref:PepSY domain-containing protein n=1 Tax=Pseudaminobacter soli (ex Zhang et al. 2022) TaxID=2831468 RepID=A0A942DVC8_9HYPH|nr:PepSY domain-containing protein [Pseudaminobacter soli]MBS3647326.1 PepSY domain-containing protein [Pseudaminobacter soli]
MDRTLIGVISGVLLAVAAGLAIVLAQPRNETTFIPGDQPVSEAQVRQKLEADGWFNVQIVREGRYYEAIASKAGQSSKFVVDSQNGRLAVSGEGGGEYDDD